MSKPSVLFMLGGENSRFVPFNNRTYKGAIALFGKPLIFRTLENLEAAGYTEMVMVLNPKDDTSEGLRGILPDAFPNLHFAFIVQTEANGMGDAVLRAKHHLSSQFVVTSGYHDNLAAIADALLAKNEPMVITSAHTNRPWEYGVLKIENGRATGVVEKPEKGQEPSQEKIQTIYLLNDDFISELSQTPEGQYSFEAALNKIMERSTVLVHRTENLTSLKYAWQLFDFQKRYFTHLKSYRDPNATIAKTAVIDESQGPVYIGAGAEIGHATHIIGPCFIGNDAFVGSFCFIRHSSIEMGSSVGSYTEVARSIIMENTDLHFGYLADSILGQGVKIGAGLITANKRLDRGGISLTIKNEKVATDRQALGILVGDKAQIGIRVSTMPGVIIGHLATVFPGQIVYANLPPESQQKSTSN